MFDATDGAATAGLNYIRLPIGASDFSLDCKHIVPYIIFCLIHFLMCTVWLSAYSWDDVSGDTPFNSFRITTPSYVFSVLKDIQAINNRIKVHIIPWSPVCTFSWEKNRRHLISNSKLQPGWTKTSGVMSGGSLASQYVGICTSDIPLHAVPLRLFL